MPGAARPVRSDLNWLAGKRQRASLQISGDSGKRELGRPNISLIAGEFLQQGGVELDLHLCAICGSVVDREGSGELRRLVGFGFQG